MCIQYEQFHVFPRIALLTEVTVKDPVSQGVFPILEKKDKKIMKISLSIVGARVKPFLLMFVNG